MADKKISALPTGVNIGPLDLIPYVDTTAAPIETKHIQWGSAILPYVGGYAPIDVTYTQLYNDVVSSTLTPLQWYRVTDYKSVNFLNGWNTANSNPIPTDPNFDPREIYVGPTDVLIVQAASTNTISPIGYSESFPNDIVQYQPLVNKIGVNIGGISNGYTLPNSTIVSGFDLQWDGTNVYFNMPTGYPAMYGHYFYIYCEFDGGNYAQDGNFEPLLPGDVTAQYPYTSSDPVNNYPKEMSRIRVENGGLKIVLLDLTNADFLDYDAGTLYVDAPYAIGDAYGWVTRRIDTLRNIDVPFDLRHRVYRRFEVDLSSLLPNLATGYYGIGDNFLGQGTTGNYYDFTSVSPFAKLVKWNSVGGPDQYYESGYSDNNVILSQMDNVIIQGVMYDNTLQGFTNSSSYGDIINNVIPFMIDCEIENNISGNIIYNLSGLDLGKTGYINGNYISNMTDVTIGGYFGSNSISTITDCVVLGTFTFNTINISGPVNFNNNKFSNGVFFTSNIFSGYGFQDNIVNASINNCIGTAGQGTNSVYNYAVISSTLPTNLDYLIIDAIILSKNLTTVSGIGNQYTKRIIERSNDSLAMTYVDGSNVTQYVNI